MKFLGPKIIPITSETVRNARDKAHADRPGAKNVIVFCSARQPKNPEYTKQAEELGRLIGLRGHNLVWGGTDAGTMQTVSNAAKSAGAKLLGVGFQQLPGEKNTYRAADVMFGATDIFQRKDAMMSLGDVAIALAGGIGSLDEIATVMEEKKGFSPIPPVILLNTNGFYDGLIRQVVTMSREGFIDQHPSELIRVADSPLDAIQLAEALQPPVLPENWHQAGRSEPPTA